MKQLSIEEKAKAYDIALDKIKMLLGTGSSCSREELEYVFPELTESEDERIRNFISNELACLRATDEKGSDRYEELTKAIDWLEKQVEQKSTDKVEPKFKVGDWVVVDGVTQQVIQIRPDGFDTNRAWNGKLTFKDVHLWTIQDAKEGDVLATPDYILVFKEFLKDNGGVSYCHYDFGAGNPQFIWYEDKNWYFGKEAIIHPATKEQRNLMFQKMYEAGYEWDADKKELKKIEHKPWSEEDEAIYYGVIETEQYMLDVVNGIKKFNVGNISIKEECTRELNWLRTLKDRVFPQPKQEWSEEDERIIRDIINTLSIGVFYKESALHPGAHTTLKEAITWLESLKERHSWYPSDEQMKALESIFAKHGAYDDDLLSLIGDLKKLREEWL